jgi:hypothetical protein
MELFRWLRHFRLAAQMVFHYRRLARFLSLPLEAPFTRQIAVIQSLFVEFQEAQCFFILATQIATTFILSKSLILLESYSIMQLQASKIILITVARSGIAVATFGLLVLHLANMASLYTVILSFRTIIVALRNIVVAMRNSSVLDFTKPPGFQSSPNCGEGPPPIASFSAGTSADHGGYTVTPTLLSSPIQDFFNMGVSDAILPIIHSLLYSFSLCHVVMTRFALFAPVTKIFPTDTGSVHGSP